MDTIHYVSKFTYFSGKKVSEKYGNILNVMDAHINYIARNDENVYTFNLDKDKWVSRVKDEVKRRWDSRVALKFNMALPVTVNKNNVKR